MISIIHYSVQFSRSVMSDSLRPYELQHARPPCPSPTPGVHPDSRPSSQWCHPAISSFVVPFSSCPQSLPASESFPMSQLFAWGGQSTGVSLLEKCKSKLQWDITSHLSEWPSSKNRQTINAGEGVEKREPSCTVGCKLIQSLWRTVWRFLIKLKIELPYDPTIPLLDIYSVKVKVAQLCPTLCNPMDWIVHGILEARILEWIAFPFSRGSSKSWDWTQVSCIASRFLTNWAMREAQSKL